MQWLSDPALRQRSHAGLNKGEASNSLRRAIFFHRQGEIRDRTFENQTFRASGLQVATLGPSNRIVMKPITITTDLGTDVIVGSGLSADDKVVNNPPDSISSGDKVRVETHAH